MLSGEVDVTAVDLRANEAGRKTRVGVPGHHTSEEIDGPVEATEDEEVEFVRTSGVPHHPEAEAEVDAADIVQRDTHSVASEPGLEHETAVDGEVVCGNVILVDTGTKDTSYIVPVFRTYADHVYV